MTIAPTRPTTSTQPTTSTRPTTSTQPTTSTTPAPQAPARNTFPIGARFPRWTPDKELGYLAEPAPRPSANVVRYPVGARFPRRDAVTVVMLIDGKVSSQEMAPASITGTFREYPIGARFPRRRN